MAGCLLLIAQAVFYFAIMALLFRLRHRLGIGVFVCALGVMHFVETYLSAVFFIRLPFGLISPGSTVMFAGKLAILLLLYIKEDAEAVRQPIYGLLIGNVLMVALVAILRLSPQPEILGGYNPDLRLLDQMGALMLWGTFLLFIDAITLILLYERLRRMIGARTAPRAIVALVIVLTFDQIAYFGGLYWVTEAPATALLGGWIAKMCATVIYSGMIAVYLRWMEGLAVKSEATRVSEVFDKLTYRHRYEDLLERSSIDDLTGVLNRGRFEATARSVVARSLASGQPLSLAMIDVDHFKQINDRHGHVMGDEVLRRVAGALRGSIRTDDEVFRYGGEEFVVLFRGLSQHDALARAETMRRAVPSALSDSFADPPTVSIGIATLPEDGQSLPDLLKHADDNLYLAKKFGRNRVLCRALAS